MTDRRLETAAERVCELDVSGVRDLLYAAHGAHRWPRHRVNEVELEWRRWRIRHWLGADDAAPAAIRLFERLSVQAGLAPAGRLDGSPGTLSYDEMFPQGPLLTKAVRERVIRRAADRENDEEYAARMASSTRRRADYVTKLNRDAYWWEIPDLISSSTVRTCIRDVATLRAADGVPFAGGPEPGWDVEHDALISKSSNMYLGAGPALIAIHEDPVLVGLISSRMGRRMYPTRCTYLRYRHGDYLGVHTDQPTCEVSVLFTVDGEAGPLRSYLDEAADDPASLDRWVLEAGHFPGGGLDFVYRPRDGLALAGRVVPHARLPQDERAIIGALFYSGLI